MVEIFSPLDYMYDSESGMPIEKGFWVELDGHEDVPTTTQKRFYTPSKNAKKGWAEKLEVYGIKPVFVYNPKIGMLPQNLSKELIEKMRLDWNRNMVESFENPKPLPPPKTLSAEDCLMRLNIEVSMGYHMGDKKWEDLTEFEKNVLEWERTYGCIWDHRRNGELSDDKTYEIDREYLFRLPDFDSLAVSLSRTINSEKAILGLKRALNIDWPFDQIYGQPWLNTDHVVGRMNGLLRGLEGFINN